MSYLNGTPAHNPLSNPRGLTMPISTGVLVVVEQQMADFYVNDDGFLCCSKPWNMPVSLQPLTSAGITPMSPFRKATQAERQESGLCHYPDTISAIVFPSPGVEAR